MRGRWWILAAYGLLTAATQMLWITFAPVTTQVAATLHASVGAVGNLAAIFPLIYVVLALPTGRWLDRRFHAALGTGAALTGAGGLLRLLLPHAFAGQILAQVVIAAGQPLVLNAITKLAARYFPAQERPTAIGLGTVSIFLGIMVSEAVGPLLWAAGGLELLLLAEGIAGAAAALLLLLAIRRPAAFADPPAEAGGMWLPKEPLLWKLGVLLFVGMGIYNALATWLQPILADYGHGALAGNLLAVTTLAGIVGAGVLPPIVAARGWRRPMLTVAVAWTLLCALAIEWSQSALWLTVWMAVEGLLLLASLPVVLEWAEVHVGQSQQGRAVGFLMLAGNLGGFVLVEAITPIVASARVSLDFVALVALAGLVTAWLLPRRTESTGVGEAITEGPGGGMS